MKPVIFLSRDKVREMHETFINSDGVWGSPREFIRCDTYLDELEMTKIELGRELRRAQNLTRGIEMMLEGARKADCGCIVHEEVNCTHRDLHGAMATVESILKMKY